MMWARKSHIPFIMPSRVIGHPLLCQNALGLSPTQNAAFWHLAPLNVESAELGIKAHVGIGQMIVDPPSHGSPVLSLSQPIDEPRYDDSCGSANPAFGVSCIPNMPGKVVCVA